MSIKLSVVIPTRNREVALARTLESFCQIIEGSGCRDQVELVCVNNFSRDDSADVGRRFAQSHDFFRYYHQDEERASAETSALNAVAYARGEYVWLFGDDDSPLDHCVKTLVDLLDTHAPSFALLNMLFDRGDQTSEYINSINSTIYFPKGIEFFRRFGLITAVTTISCLCFKRSTFNIAVFEELAGISEIYSHSFSLFVNYHDSPVLFIAPPLLRYVATHESIELERIGGHSKSRGLSTYYSFGQGLARLVAAASLMSGVPVSVIAAVEEMAIDKTPFLVRPTLLWCFIVRTLLIQCQNTSENRFSAEDIDELHRIARQLENPTAEMCWNLAIQINSEGERLIDELVIKRVSEIVGNYEEAYFERIRPRTSAAAFETVYFQNGVIPYNFSPDAGSQPPTNQESAQIAVVLHHEASCAELPLGALKAALTNCRDALSDIHVCWFFFADAGAGIPSEAIQQLVGLQAFPTAENLQKIAPYVAVIPAGSLLHPNSLLFGLNYLRTARVDLAVFNRSEPHSEVRLSHYLGSDPTSELIHLISRDRFAEVRTELLLNGGQRPFLVSIRRFAELTGQEHARTADPLSAVRINYPLAMTSPIPTMTCDESALGQDAVSVSHDSNSSRAEPSRVLEVLGEFNKIVLLGLGTAVCEVPVPPSLILEIYQGYRPDPTTTLGAFVLDNLVLLLAIRRSVESKWTFCEPTKVRLTSELRALDEVLHSGDLERRYLQLVHRRARRFRSRRQRIYTWCVEWLNRHDLARKCLVGLLQAIAKADVFGARRQFARIHRHYYRPLP